VLANRRLRPLPPSMKTFLMLNPLICASTTSAAWPSQGTAGGWSALLNSMFSRCSLVCLPW
jgi:hypothetical protein